MKILFSSYAYAPGIGGIETVSALLAREFVAAGNDIVLVTESGGESAAKEVFPVIRRPSVAQLRQCLRWCDVVFQNNISLRHLIPALLARKPVLLVHQTWTRNTRGEIGWNDRIKRLLLHRASNVAISTAIARDVDAPCQVIGNPYEDRVFRLLPEIARDRDIIFVGRLVSDKGVDLLLSAGRVLRPAPTVTIVGSGPEEEKLRDLARGMDVVFAGAKREHELAQLLNRHHIIAVPSRWAEPFGVVALEGIACGCVAVASNGGGLPEAIGNCGLTFSNGNEHELRKCLQRLMTDASLRECLRANAPAHLEHFRGGNIAQRYLERLATL
ncbi:MAG: glycosyltransferase family 4 protein [Verrucomicrobia bacterium]|nr:glycosyltransferase family 4 protein [Verrucomicrobiota bacterium]